MDGYCMSCDLIFAFSVFNSVGKSRLQSQFITSEFEASSGSDVYDVLFLQYGIGQDRQ